MYGIINKALEELVTETFGERVWENIKTKSNIDIDYFISNQSYNNQITYDIAIAISNETKTPLNETLILFGEWWILKTAKEKYGSLLSFGGKNIKEFLEHLPDFHTRVMLLYPNLTPPEFKIINSKENVDLKERGTFYINIGDGHVNSLYSKKIIFKKYQKLYFKKFKDEIVNSLKNKVLESQKKIKFFFELEIFNLRNDKIKNIDLIINMMVVKHVIKKLGFKEVCLITDDYFTQQIFSDNFSKIKNLNKLSKKSKIDLAIFKIIKFYIKTFFLLIFLKMFKKNKKFLKKYQEACISIKPIFFKDGKENFFKKQKILKYNFLLTDETHLNHSFLDILKIIKNDEKNLVHVESYISFKNLFSSLLKSFELLFLVKKSKLKFVVKGVDLSIFYSNYLIASTINRAKLFIYDKALLVLLKKNEINRFRLYLFEYSFGFYLINLIKTNLNKTTM